MNPILKIVTSILDGFITTWYIAVFTRAKIRAWKIFIGSTSIGLISALLFLNFIEYAMPNPLLSLSLMIVLLLAQTVFASWLYGTSFFNTLMGRIAFFLVDAFYEILCELLFSCISNNLADARKNVSLQIVGTIPSYPFYIFSLIIIRKIISTKLFDSFKNKNYAPFYIVYGFIAACILGINTAILFAFKIKSIEIFLVACNSIVFLILNIIFICFLNIYNKKKQESEYQKLYIQTLKDVTNQLATSKHNFDNIIATISGYIEFSKWDSLSAYINEVIKKQTTVGLNNFSILERIKEPGVIGLILSKLCVIKEKNINCRLTIDSNEIIIAGMKIGDLCECLGILIDNAFEATLQIENGFININIKQVEKSLIFIVENHVATAIELNRIFEKGWSTKGEGRGLGLWQITNYVNSYNNVILNTTLKNNVLIQEFIINL